MLYYISILFLFFLSGVFGADQIGLSVVRRLSLLLPDHTLSSLLENQDWQIQLSTTVLLTLLPSDTEFLRLLTKTHTPSVCFEHKGMKVTTNPQCIICYHTLSV